MNENCRVYGIFTCMKLVQVGGQREVQEVLVITRIVKGDCVGKCIAKRMVAFEFLVMMISSKRPRGCI